MKLSRRSLAIGGAALAAAIAVPAFGIVKSRSKSSPDISFATPLPFPSLLDARALANNVSFAATPGVAKFLPDLETPTYGYVSSFLGPVIRVHRGDTVAMSVTNGLDRPTSVHWHGVMVPSERDGGPYNTIAPGETWKPSLKIDQPAATAWYHPHPHGDTARQVYMGLAGLLYIEDGTAQELGLPLRYGIDDLPLIVQDRSFNHDGSFAYDNSPMAILHGLRGDTIIVNGSINPAARVPKGIVRLRVLNGANATNFKLRFDDARPFAIVASDNGFIAKPVSVTEFIIAPGERYEVLVDFTDGGSPILQTYPDRNGRFGSGAMQQLKSLTASITDDLMPIMQFVADASIATAVRSMPARLVDVPDPDLEPQRRRRSFILDSMTAANAPMTQAMGGMENMEGMDHSKMTGGAMRGMDGLAMGMKMGINGRPFDMTRVDAEVKLGSEEIWEIRGTEMAHPFHIHGASFRVLNMDGAASPAHLAGWKDTVLVNEWAQLLVSFKNRADPVNPFLFHCHILEHEDAGMMAQYVAI